MVEVIGFAVTVLFSAVVAVQGFTLGRARSSALLVLASAVGAVTVANAFRVGLFNGVHLLGALTSLLLGYWTFVRSVTQPQPQSVKVRR